ncbi:isoprenylcysteine carboxylmethyltransferase family protein [Brevibacterium samyangense]
MTDSTAAALALGLYLFGLITAFGVRTWLHRRRSGSSGFRGLTGAPGSAEWWGGILFAAALVLGTAGPLLALTGITPPWPLPAGTHWAGLVVTVAGLLGVLAAQAGMGASWRIGVDATERTALVTTGAFALVRNPVFTAMLAALAGMVLLVPTPVSAAAPVVLLAAVELQVRCVEEPYLLRTHGDTYARYAARVGRFLPGIGRLRGCCEISIRRPAATTCCGRRLRISHIWWLPLDGAQLRNSLLKSPN